MPLPGGAKLGPYEIASARGAGGKGLDRDPVWSPDGNMLYWMADRNGTRAAP